MKKEKIDAKRGEHDTPIHFAWRPQWGILTLGLVLLVLLLKLGVWQWHRADEKREILASQAAVQQLEPLGWSDLAMEGTIDPYRRVRLQGAFDQQRYLLLDNRTRNGRIGYEVIGLFIESSAENSRFTWVNRGWIEGSSYRNQWPEVKMPKGSLNIDGFLYNTPDSGIDPAPEPHKGGEWPKRIQAYSNEYVDTLTQRPPAVSQQLRLDSTSMGALTTDWITVNVSPEKHIGYSVQWFSMAFALSVLLLFINSNLAEWLRRKRNTP